MPDLIKRLESIKIIPVVAVEDAEDILPLGTALADNGLPACEITFRSDAAAKAIEILHSERPDILIGAGTVLNKEQVRLAQKAGASFIVSPGFNPNTVKACQDADIPIVPGVNNPSTIESAMELGLTHLKFFPAEASGGVKMIKALCAPYFRIRFMPTGGINPDNVRDYLQIPQVFACGGSWMASVGMIARKDWNGVAEQTKQATRLLATV